MAKLREHIEFIDSEPIPLDLPQGRCVLAQTTGLFDLFVLPSKCYAILASWLDESAPVGMFVNFIPGRQKRAVHSIYASDEFRGLCDGTDLTLPVLIGTWLFDTKRLTLHSPDRTAAGDRWARAVGGELPGREQIGADMDAVTNGRTGLALLNELAWPVATLAQFYE